MSESKVQTGIRQALAALPYVRLYRNKQAGRGRLKAGLGTGTSDLIGWVTIRFEDPIGGNMQDNAIFLAIEVKANAKADVSPEQLSFLADVRAAGGIGAIVWTVEQAVQLVKRAHYGDVEAERLETWGKVLGDG